MNDCLFIIDQPPRPSNDDINPNHQVRVVAKLDYKGAEANACLIAAAPDLLKAVKGLLDSLVGDEFADDIPSVAAARAVVAKAEGR
jgi:hypothetical protein